MGFLMEEGGRKEEQKGRKLFTEPRELGPTSLMPAALARSTDGLPGETRPGPRPYTRFANLGAAFFEKAEGVWEIQLLDRGGFPMGEAARFVLGPDDNLRELYFRYREK